MSMESMILNENSVISQPGDLYVGTSNKASPTNLSIENNTISQAIDSTSNCDSLPVENGYDSQTTHFSVSNPKDSHLKGDSAANQDYSFVPLSKDLPAVSITSSVVQTNFDSPPMSKGSHEILSNGYYIDHNMTMPPQVFQVPGTSYLPMNVEHTDYDKMYIGPLSSYSPITHSVNSNGTNYPRGDMVVNAPSVYSQPVSVLPLDNSNYASSNHRYTSSHQYSNPNTIFHNAGHLVNNSTYGSGTSVISMLPHSRSEFPMPVGLLPHISSLSSGNQSSHSYHSLNIDSSVTENMENGHNAKTMMTNEEKTTLPFTSTNSQNGSDDGNRCIHLANGEMNEKNHNPNSESYTKECDMANRDANDTGSNNTGEYYVMVHVNGGETFSVKVGGQLQHIQGPATVRMVSKKGPPMLMPMQVPPGHLVQQIVDENGILTHIILSPYPPPQLHGAPLPPLILSPGMPSSHPPPPHIMACGPSLSSEIPVNHIYGPTSVPQSGIDDRSEYNLNRIRASPLPNTPRVMKRSSAPYYDEGSASAMARRRKSRNKTIITAGNNSASYPRNVEVRNASSAGGEDISTGSLGKSDSVLQPTQEEDEGNPSLGSHSSQNSFKSMVRRILNATPPPEVSDVEARSASIQLYLPDIPDHISTEINEADITYDLYLSENGPEGYYKCIFRGEAMEICLRDLKPDTEYYVKSSTSYSSVHGARSAATRFKTQPCEPNAPKPPTLGQKTRNTLALKWSNAIENGSKLTGFILEWKNVSDSKLEWAELYAGLQRYFKASKLSSSTSYSFRLAAVNSYGQGPWSEEVSFSTSGLAPEKPDPPQLMRQEVHGLGLSWNKRTSDEKFIMEMEDEATCHGFIPVFLGDQLSHFFENLRRNTRYRFRLASENVEGRSQWSEVVTYTTHPDVPSPPKKLEVKGKIAATKFSLCWSEPDDDGGAPVNEYRIQVCQCAASSPLARRTEVSVGSDVDLLWTQVYQGGARECHVTQLAVGSVVWVQGACHSVGGWGAWSPIPLRVRLIPAAPGPVTGFRLASEKSPIASQLHLLWNKPEKDGGAELLSYEVQQIDQLTPPESPVKRLGGETTSEKRSDSKDTPSGDEHVKIPVKESKKHSTSDAASECIVYEGNLTECHVLNLIPGHEYLFRVRAKNENGLMGPWTEPSLQVFCGPCQPVGPNPPVASCSLSPPICIQVAWEPPTKCYGSPVTEYRLEMRQQVSNKYNQVYMGKETHFEVRQSLEPATGYLFRVQAINAAGASPFSADSEVCVTCSSTPGPASHLFVYPELSEDEQTRILSLNGNEDKHSEIFKMVNEMYNRADILWVTWREAVSHGSPITRYTVEWSLDLTHQHLIDMHEEIASSSQPSRSILSADVNGRQCFHIITDLKPNTQYRVRVQSHNEVGSGPYTNFIRAITKSLPPSPPTLECMQSQSNSLKLKWIPHSSNVTSSSVAVSGSSTGLDGATYYQLDMSRTSSSGWHTVYNGTLLSHKIVKLTEYTNYYFRIRASNKFGVGAWSSVCRFSTSKAAPPSLRAPRVNDVSTTSALIEWSPIKPLGQDVILYALQLLAVSGNDLEYRQVYRGSETSFRLQGLHMGTEYLVRVSAIRLSSNVRSRQVRKRRRIALKMEPSSTSADEERETNTESDLNEDEEVEEEDVEEDEENHKTVSERPEKEVMCEIMGTFSQATSFVTRKMLQVGNVEHGTKKKSGGSTYLSSSSTKLISVSSSSQKLSQSTLSRFLPQSFPNLAPLMRRPRLTDNEVALLLLAVFGLLVVLVVYLVQSYLL